MIPKVKDLRFGSLSCYKTDSFSRFLVQSGQMEIEGDFEGIVKERGANKITNTVTPSDYFFLWHILLKLFDPNVERTLLSFSFSILPEFSNVKHFIYSQVSALFVILILTYYVPPK